ncbi:unknown [Choristoneura fumiferana multiple nucleopolyhedrovirus]|uniref:Ac78 n=1 Tax=Choristoneura fumiferana nuclear polyhedrosis virus TaxID=208973 RepID=Q7TLS4_NPVCF|nr:unknown [Choristoneura fumiferana multiple nucleopolyhedrovirus]AAP29855.1 unknown [Choristoneura fumiferana multiple nucleopolyhedrovirus]AGR56964.1 hypothetical protein [Choristoneura occidentalis alphabaculovirus]
MNLDVPYYRLGNHERVDYIPLKLALSDDAPAPSAHEAEPAAYKVAGEMDAPANQMSAGLIVLISLIAFVALFLLLYVIYYFVILRDRPEYSNDIDDDPSFVFNKFD